MSVPGKDRNKPLVVLDTNILVSYLWGSAHCCRIVRAMLLENRFTPVITPGMIEEFDAVISRPNIKRRIGELAPAIFRREYLLFAHITFPGKELSVCDDPDDNMLLECANSAGAGYIVTGDDDLLRLKKFEKTRIVTPLEFIDTFLDR